MGTTYWLEQADGMDRRAFLLTSLAGALAAPLGAEAQRVGNMPHIGLLVLFSFEHPQARELYGAFRQGLRELGYIEGESIVIESRSANGKLEELPGLFAEFARLKVNVVCSLGGTPAALAAKRTHFTIPFVAPGMADPVRDGLVTSLAPPGGTITGSSFLGPGLVPKRVELLKQTIPAISRIAVLSHPTAYAPQTMRDMLKELEGAAQALRLRLQLLEVRAPSELESAFSAMGQEHAEALIVMPSVMLYEVHRRIVDLGNRNRLPTIYAFREAVEAGGLMAYGSNLADLFRRAATQVDKILKGTKPSDIPVEQPTKFELVINAKAAKALGLTIPPALLARADQVIE